MLRAAAAAGELAPAAAGVPAAGTWRPAPPAEGEGPGTYATSVPILVARAAGQDARSVAVRLAAALSPVPWIARARASGAGYLTVTVTTRHLAALPGRIVAAGQRAVPAAPALPDPAEAPDWPRAWDAQHDALIARLAGAAGSDDRDFAAERHDAGDRRPASDSPSWPRTPSGRPGQGAAPRAAPDPAAFSPAAFSPVAAFGQVPGGLAGGGLAGGGPVASAVAWYGADAVRYALTRTAGPRPAAIERQLGLPLDLDNPFVLVRYAHAHAASTARWAADLARATGPGGAAAGPGAAATWSGAGTGGPEPGPEPGPVAGAGWAEPGPAAGPGGPEPGLVAGAGGPEPGSGHARPEPQPAELALITSLSWSGERTAAAARRRRPADVCAYLEQVAGAYLHCARDCPPLPPGGAAAPPDPASPLAAARLELAAAARSVLAAGLRMAGVAAPVQPLGS